MKKYLLSIVIASFTLIFASVPYTVTDNSTAVKFTIPDTYTLPYNPTGNTPTELATFAWQEMIALNWKATYDGNTNLNRDEADSGWTYKESGTPDHVVWETYAHRTELRPANTAKGHKFDVVNPKNDLDAKPVYTFGTSSQQVKITPKNGAKLDLLNCLDEDNEIGSCILFANGGDDLSSLMKDNQIVYQAKINKAGFVYRRDNFKHTDDLKKARDKVAPSGKADKTKLIPGKNPAQKKKNRKTASCDSKTLTTAGYICFPCSDKTTKTRGVIEIKTAWRKMQSGDDLSKYFHREAIYFSDVSATSANAHNDIFLLIGMHIIHKTKDFPTFVIATFEHESVIGDNYRYISTPGGDADFSELYKINNAADVERDRYNSTYRPVNDAVHRALETSGINANQYLKHYNLIGVQGGYTNGYADMTERTSPSFFLSNYVIETDKHLAYFFGSFGAPQKGTQDGFFNLITKEGKAITAGGCKGCHGVAQTTGSDMSFLMDGTKPVNMPDEGFLTTTEIKSKYFAASQITMQNAKSVFFSSVDGKQYLDKEQSGDILKLISYDNNFTNNKNARIDADGYPRANFKASGVTVVTKTVMHKKDTIGYSFTLQYNNTSTSAAAQYVYYDAVNKVLSLTKTKANATTLYGSFKQGNGSSEQGGIVELYLDKNLTMEPLILNMAKTGITKGKSTDTVLQLVVDGFDRTPYYVTYKK